MNGDYTAWLVENHDTGNPRYLSLSNCMNIVWVDNADDAVHFARRADADRMCMGVELQDLWVTDHLWCGPARDPVIPCEPCVSESSFRVDLEKLINQHSKENGSNTPDFILAHYLCDCLKAFDNAALARDNWYGGSTTKDQPFDTREELHP